MGGDDFIASSGPAIGGRIEGQEVRRIREQINELLKLNKHTTLKLPQDGNFRRKIEKQLEGAWKPKNRALYKKFTVAPEKAEEGKGAEPEKGVGATDLGVKSAAADEALGAGDGADRRKKREFTDAEEPESYAQVVAQLKKDDSMVSSVARLRSTLRGYQASRNNHVSHLQSVLFSKDADRLGRLRNRAAGVKAERPASSDRLEQQHEDAVQERMKTQHEWYRGLLYHVQADKKELVDVAHFVFNFVKQVLEYGELFTREMYFAMMSKIDNSEFTAVIASVVVEMVRGIENLDVQDVLAWFRVHRGEVPHEVRLLVGEREKDDDASLGGGDTPRISRTLTFVTQQ